MRFLSIYRGCETNAPPSAEEMAKMSELIERRSKSGHLISTEGCLPSSAGFRVSLDEGRYAVTDGPFTEAKEIVGGFALLQAESREEALQLAREFLSIVGHGECEVRQLHEAHALAL